MLKPKKRIEKQIVGWREWVALPNLNISQIKAKVDTGAKTSALHAAYLSFSRKNGKRWVTFTIHPLQRTLEKSKTVTAEVIDSRVVRSSGGHVTIRPVIFTTLKMGKRLVPMELTLVNRDLMGFRLLIGRSVLRKKFIVDPGKSFLL